MPKPKAQNLQSFLRLAAEAAEFLPDSGQFAATRETSTFMEYHACREALDWLCREKGWPQPASATQPDPPDVIFKLEDGSSAGFEFARVLHAKTIEAIKHRRSQGDSGVYYQNWTPPIFQRQLNDLILEKERKFARHLAKGLCHRPLVLVLGSDGTSSGSDLIDSYTVTSEIFSEILVHFGYPGNPHNTGSTMDPVAFPSIFDICGT